MNITHNHYAGNLCKLKPMDNERNTNIYFLFNSLVNSSCLADKSICSSSQFFQIVSLYHCQFICHEGRTRVSLHSQCPLEGQLQHDTLPLPSVFRDVFLQNSSSSLSLSSYQLANSKLLSKLQHHVCLNH